MFIISASIRVVHWNLNRNILLDIVLKGYPTKQVRSLLRIFCLSELGLRPSPPDAILSEISMQQPLKENTMSNNFRKAKVKEL